MPSIDSPTLKTSSHRMQHNHRPIRILHVVGCMNRGGIETWLMHVLRHIDRDRFHINFVVHVAEPCAYDEEIRQFGSQIIPCLYPTRPLNYARHFKQILRDYQPDIVHSHVGHFNGYVLRLAQQEHIPVRIAHSHNDLALQESQSNWQSRAYITVMKRWIKHYATLGLGCSQKAIASLFGTDWTFDPRWQLLYYGIDLAPFVIQGNPAQLRQELGIPQDAFVIGHIGRFAEQKNHTFLIEIMAEIAQRNPKTHLLLVGQGDLKSRIEQKISDLGLTHHVTFAGSRSDIAQLMQGVMDIFVFPSFHEGLPLVLLEAQAANLECVISDAITSEIEQNHSLMHRLSLTQLPTVWADTVLAHQDRKGTMVSTDAVEKLKASPFNIEVAIKQLELIYQTQFIQHVASVL
jgi:glycosyltransferase involved in cell wall biosynthesis